MKIAVAVLTFGRPWLLERTLASLGDVDKLILMDNNNGMDMQTGAIVAEWELDCFIMRNMLPVGAAMNGLIDHALSYEPDLVVFSADDYEYKEGWREDLEEWWEEADEDVAITSCHLEPIYPWNTIKKAVSFGGRTGLSRRTLPGSSWTLRAGMWPEIGPIPERTGQEDTEVCLKLLDKGYRLCALDLAEHIGEEQSAWGNNSYKMAKPLNKEEWGIA